MANFLARALARYLLNQVKDRSVVGKFYIVCDITAAHIAGYRCRLPLLVLTNGVIVSADVPFEAEHEARPP